ncbi:MAG TPA: thioredoxin family protein [Clostridiaceae bacterium]|nr:thioredoxin family protein [Clostridiaceae bacterium]
MDKSILEGATGYLEYLDKVGSEFRSAYEKTELSEETRQKVSGLKEERNLLVFTEAYCPDCVVALPFVQRMMEENPNIHVYIKRMKGAQDFLREAVGDARIPTVISFNGKMEPVGAYVEFPEALKDMMRSASVEDKKEFVSRYRRGTYNDLIEDALLALL